MTTLSPTEISTTISAMATFMDSRTPAGLATRERRAESFKGHVVNSINESGKDFDGLGELLADEDIDQAEHDILLALHTGDYSPKSVLGTENPIGYKDIEERFAISVTLELGSGATLSFSRGVKYIPNWGNESYSAVESTVTLDGEDIDLESDQWESFVDELMVHKLLFTGDIHPETTTIMPIEKWEAIAALVSQD